MRYQLVIIRQFEKDFKEVEKEVRELILKKIKKLRKHPYLKVKKLNAAVKGKYSWWAGDYRIVGTINGKTKEVALYCLAHRKKLYEGRNNHEKQC